MKKFYSLLLLGGLLFFGVQNVWGNNTKTTVFYAMDPDVKDYSSIRVNFQLETNNANSWYNVPMTNTGKTYAYNDKDYIVYEASFEDWYDGVACLQFQRSNDDFASLLQNQPIGSWEPQSTYNRKMYIHNVAGWVDVYSIGGLWDNWTTHRYIGAGDGDVTIDIPASYIGYNFKITYGSTWYGKNETTPTDIYCTTGNLSSVMDNTSGADGYIWATVAGSYTFSLKASTKTVTVTYPTSYTRTVTSEKWGTLCLPVATTDVTGANFYTINGKYDGKLYLTAVPKEGGKVVLSAGTPYLFQATSTSLVATLNNTVYEKNVSTTGTNGLIGTYIEGFDVNGESDYYILQNNTIVPVNASGNKLHANSAYFNMATSGDNYVPTLVSAPAAPGIREIPFAPNGATNIQGVEANEVAVKFYENGQLFIRKDGLVYDMTGRMVK